MKRNTDLVRLIQLGIRMHMKRKEIQLLPLDQPNFK